MADRFFCFFFVRPSFFLLFEIRTTALLVAGSFEKRGFATEKVIQGIERATALFLRSFAML
jgi:hypothetical protein